MIEKREIHLLYAPTTFCNMGCKYCYLGDNTDKKIDEKKIFDTLVHSVEKFTKNNCFIFNLSLHGGEATTIKPSLLKKIFSYMKNYYSTNPELSQKNIHIKTNLYNFDTLFDLFEEYNISVSASIDFPLALHEKYRVTKKGTTTLPKIIENLKLLVKYSGRKKISCVINKEHYQNIDNLIEDIKFVHYNLGFDMNNFNFMFGFESNKNKEKFSDFNDSLEMLTLEEQVDFYNKIKQAFLGSDLESAFKNKWFEEFTPNFCSHKVNCGTTFFLLDGEGDIFSCPRGQSSNIFKYGNIYKDSINKITKKATDTISSVKNNIKMSNECLKCNYIHLCNNGCPFVSNENNLSKSYTCLLQKEIYKDNSELYKPLTDEELSDYVHFFSTAVQKKFLFEIEQKQNTKLSITSELFEEKNFLQNIIKNDPILLKLYEKESFKINVNNEVKEIINQPFKNDGEICFLDIKAKTKILIKKDIFLVNCKENNLANNSLTIIALRDTKVIYGDEQREKMEHTFLIEINYNMIKNNIFDDDYFFFDLSSTLKCYQEYFIEGVRNSLFFTTKEIRKYHYEKQKNNAFYHIQAINLPFHIFDFIWIGESDEK
jgi:uncharacterized protein